MTIDDSEGHKMTMGRYRNRFCGKAICSNRIGNKGLEKLAY
jgi:hypothetical protein